MRASVEKIQELTITDDCTGLYNARHLYKTLETEVYRSARFGYEFTVVFIDLDHFKQVNDTHGHLIGSKLLTEIGYLIKAQLRLIDYAFRYGGDEFVVLLPQTGKDAGAGGGATFARQPAHQHVLPGRRSESECARLDGRGHLSARRQDAARDHSPGGRDDVSGEEHFAGQHRDCSARGDEVGFFSVAVSNFRINSVKLRH